MSRSVLKQYVRQVITEAEDKKIIRGPNGVMWTEQTHTVYEQSEFDYIMSYLRGKDDGVKEVGPFKFKFEGEGEVASEREYADIVDFVRAMGGKINRPRRTSLNGFAFRISGTGEVPTKIAYDEIVYFINSLGGSVKIERLAPFKFRTTWPAWQVQAMLVNYKT